MKNCIFWALFLCLLFNQVFSAEQQNSNPLITFFVQHEVQLKNDYVEITLQIEAKDSSLTTAIQAAAATVDQISTLAKDYCNENAKKKAECKDAVEVGKFNVEPRYQTIRKQPVFMGFTVKHEMALAVKAVQNIGYLVDQILAKSGITLQSFEWKALEEPKTHEEAVAEGIQQGEGLCEQMGYKMGRIISVEQINEDEAPAEEQAEQEQGEEGQEEEAQEGEKALFKFMVECVEVSSKK